ncbi:TetR/AcrR family transcriptional regulator [Rhodococcus sp. OK302]|uniref:TetR/AcrR family transcriptional regulator n=1 Tax=Rhodococcus sp. OK302 TaxID=1882769 RepID=UPI000B93C2F6|nr:TetR/AcrR family transcriptional regulator [Rhodococcus sp. OK302]OYD67253.1 TetR family transcriptional regulator [Rhodococcus sp. OK302]
MLNSEIETKAAAPPLNLVFGAAECVRRNGVRGFRLSEVATIAGVSRGTVYNAFGDKETAINAGLAYLCNAFIDGLAAAVTPQTTLRSQIGEAAALIYEHATTPQALAPPLRTDSIITTLLEHYGDQLCRTWAAFWAALVADAQGRGEVDSTLDTMHAGDWIVRVLLSLEILPLSVAGFSSADDARTRIGNLMLDGLAPRR